MFFASYNVTKQRPLMKLTGLDVCLGSLLIFIFMGICKLVDCMHMSVYIFCDAGCVVVKFWRELRIYYGVFFL